MARKDEERDDELNEDEESEGSDASADERDDDARSSDESDAGDDDSQGDEDSQGDDSPEEHRRERAAEVRADLASEAQLLAHESEQTAAEQLGPSIRYVHAAFFGAAILTAFLASKVVALVWGALADWPAATRQVPILLRYAEDERGSVALVLGAGIGLVAVIQVYRKEHIRRWADEVALELTKVAWPSRETVSNGTVVVIVASLIATVYVALLDRFWGFLTQLVYGA
jgi:preprotein translocase subunit SecE